MFICTQTKLKIQLTPWELDNILDSSCVYRRNPVSSNLFVNTSLKSE